MRRWRDTLPPAVADDGNGLHRTWNRAASRMTLWAGTRKWSGALYDAQPMKEIGVLAV